MTIQEFLQQFGPWLIGIAALITAVVSARNSNVENISKNVATLQAMVNELVESRELLKKEKLEEKTKLDKEISDLKEEVRLLNKLHEQDQEEIHDLHALIGREVVAKLKIQIEKD